MPSAPPLSFDIDDSDDNDAVEAATDPMDSRVEVKRGEMRQTYLLHLCVFKL